MAAGTLPSPGKIVNGLEIGACIDEGCGHTDCECTRNQAASLCPLCNQPIGYETRIYNHKGTLNHADCLERDMGQL